VPTPFAIQLCDPLCTALLRHEQRELLERLRRSIGDIHECNIESRSRLYESHQLLRMLRASPASFSASGFSKDMTRSTARADSASAGRIAWVVGWLSQERLRA
jgi:hypothetical protein